MPDYYNVLVGLGLGCIIGARVARFASESYDYVVPSLQSRAANARVGLTWILCAVVIYALFWSWKREGAQAQRSSEGIAKPTGWMSREEWLRALAQLIVAHTLAFKADDLFAKTSSRWVEAWIDPGLSTMMVMTAMTVYLVSEDDVGFISADFKPVDDPLGAGR